MTENKNSEKKAKKSTKIKKKINWIDMIPLMLIVIMGIIIGILNEYYIDMEEKTLGEWFIHMGILLLGFYVLYTVQIMIHEAGHLIFGLLSGYRFSSFRILNFMILRQEEEEEEKEETEEIKESGERKRKEKLKLCRYGIAGTGGQCLMVPPDIVDGKMPVVLYNLGGCLMDLLSGVICFLIGLYADVASVVTLTLFIMALIGIESALVNAIPLNLSTISNDGYNLYSMKKDSSTQYSLWLQLKLNEQVARGKRLKDMPEEWFKLPSDDEIKNAINTPRCVFACNRLMDAHRFCEAREKIDHYLNIESKMAGVHRNLMLCDKIYLMLLDGDETETVKHFYTKELQEFMKVMENFPSVLRTEYAIALLMDGDGQKADKIKQKFEKAAKKYPFSGDLESERELMDIAQNIA